jgi:hypothetical protein
VLKTLIFRIADEENCINLEQFVKLIDEMHTKNFCYESNMRNNVHFDLRT